MSAVPHKNARKANCLGVKSTSRFSSMTRYLRLDTDACGSIAKRRRHVNEDCGADNACVVHASVSVQITLLLVVGEVDQFTLSRWVAHSFGLVEKVPF